MKLIRALMMYFSCAVLQLVKHNLIIYGKFDIMPAGGSELKESNFKVMFSL